MDAMESYQNICRNICWLRLRYGLTQKEMAAILAISVGTLKRIERVEADCRVNCWMLRRLCDYLDLSADVILREKLHDPAVEL